MLRAFDKPGPSLALPAGRLSFHRDGRDRRSPARFCARQDCSRVRRMRIENGVGGPVEAFEWRMLLFSTILQWNLGRSHALNMRDAEFGVRKRLASAARDSSPRARGASHGAVTSPAKCGRRRICTHRGEERLSRSPREETAR